MLWALYNSFKSPHLQQAPGASTRFSPKGKFSQKGGLTLLRFAMPRRIAARSSRYWFESQSKLTRELPLTMNCCSLGTCKANRLVQRKLALVACWWPFIRSSLFAQHPVQRWENVLFFQFIFLVFRGRGDAHASHPQTVRLPDWKRQKGLRYPRGPPQL